jgi:hypothetical protein
MLAPKYDESLDVEHQEDSCMIEMAMQNDLIF